MLPERHCVSALKLITKEEETMREIDFYLVDAFSDKTFGGNAAAVCPLEEWLPDETLLKMAQQHNQSETAFLCEPTADLNCAGSPRCMKLTSAAMRPSRHHTSFLSIWTIRIRKSTLPRASWGADGQTQRRLADAEFPAWSTKVVDNPPPVLFARWASRRQKRCASGETTSWCWRASSRWRH